MKEFAIAKLKKESGEGTYDRYANVFKAPLLQKLYDFCVQNDEFAQAIAQSDKMFADCCASISKKITGNAISDETVYAAAVQFYFPGAGIKVVMKLDLCASVGGDSDDKPAGAALELDLFSFM